jgi:trans-aconitate methyltransferase
VNRDFDQYLANYLQLPFEKTFEIYRHKKIIELIAATNIEKLNNLLEIGPGLNPIFSNLKEFEIVHVLEPIKVFYQSNKEEFSKKQAIKFFNCTLGEFYESSHKSTSYDLILLSSVLHEIPNYIQALEQCFSMLSQGGKIIIIVPNNKSLHRMIGEQSGIHPTGEALTKTEIIMQQNTSFSVESLRLHLEKIGFETLSIKTEFIKIFPHHVMQELIDKKMLNEKTLDFFSETSSLIPNFGAEIFYLGTKL